MQGVNPKRPRGMTRPEKKKPLRTATHVVRELFEVLDADGRSYRSICDKAGLSHVSLSHWRSGKATPRMADFENFIQVIGYRLTLEKIEQ
jgi:transcriptional regulator with XRE-family HTH domain